MALSNLTVKDQFPGDNATTTFAIPFTPIFDDSLETKVYVDDVLQTEGAIQDYTLTGAPDIDSFHVNVEFVTAPLTGEVITIRRELALTQSLDLISAGTVNLSTLERHLDGIVAKIQQMDEFISRGPIFKNTTPEAVQVLPDPTALYVLAWNAAATQLENVSVESISGGALDDLPGDFVSHSVTNGQSATDLTDETTDGATSTSAVYEYEIIRGTTVMATGRFALHYLNSTWRLEDGGYEGEVHGVTFTVSQTTTVAQLRAATDSGAGSGTIKLSKRLIPA